jgi:hypothetical protein
MSATDPKWDDGEPLISEQPETWLYWNPRGQLVLRQRQEMFEDNPYLLLSIEFIPQLIAALEGKLAEATNIGTEPSEPSEPRTEPEIEIEAGKRPLTAAERQRRRRNKSHGSHETSHGSHEERDEPALPLSPVTTC